MPSIAITYRIKLSEKVTEVFEFHLDDKTGELLVEAPINPPAWTALDFRQCSHCPLDKTQHPHCPIALQLNNFIVRFHDTSSIDEVELEVVTEERCIKQRLPLQRAIGSMLGLVSPTCGCPKMAYMKPMARFHLPLASEEETLFRVTGMYLLAQHLLDQQNRVKSVPNFSGLKAVYEELHILNKAIATRLRTATESDSSKNAIALLDMYSNLMPMMIDDHLPALKDLFSAYYTNPIPVVKPSAGLSLSLVDIEPTDKAAPAANAAPAADMQTAVPTLAVTEAVSKDKELQDLLSQEAFVSELESLLGSDNKATIKVDPAPAPEQASTDRPRGRAVFKIADD
jgi:hypothetical protein